MKTTKKDFKEFKEEFLRWVDIFGLKGYKITIEHKKINSFAQINVCHEAWSCIATFTTKIKDSFNEFEGGRRSGKHEAIHFLLGRYNYLAKLRFARSDEIWDEEEKIVRILEQVL